MSDTPEHPGPYRGRRNDYQALSEYWAKRSRYYEATAERLREAIEEAHALYPDEGDMDDVLATALSVD